MNSRNDLVTKLFDDIEDRHVRSLQGVREARNVDPVRFDETATTYLRWAIKEKGEAWLPRMVDAFVQFSTDVNLAQVRYEADGEYENKSFDDCVEETYSDREAMQDYLWGIYLTNFLWSHHMEISLFFQDRFLRSLGKDPEIIEIAPGHGGWGAMALSKIPGAVLNGYDISPSSIDVAETIARGAGISDRASYEEKNALDLSSVAAESADACICSFLVEHLERPEALTEVIAHLLRPGGTAFVTGALTAAQVDHIYEFKRESELIQLCETYHLRALESFSGAPKRTLPKARFVPRSMAILCQKSTWI